MPDSRSLGQPPVNVPLAQSGLRGRELRGGRGAASLLHQAAGKGQRLVGSRPGRLLLGRPFENQHKFSARSLKSVAGAGVPEGGVAVSSYGKGTSSSGQVQITKDLSEDISGRHIIVVEDILDSGNTLSYLLKILEHRHPASIRLCTLLDKPDRRVKPVEVHYSGFTIPDAFVVGYGLDYAEKYRNLPYIGILKPEVYGG